MQLNRWVNGYPLGANFWQCIHIVGFHGHRTLVFPSTSQWNFTMSLKYCTYGVWSNCLFKRIQRHPQPREANNGASRFSKKRSSGSNPCLYEAAGSRSAFWRIEHYNNIVCQRHTHSTLEANLQRYPVLKMLTPRTFCPSSKSTCGRLNSLTSAPILAHSADLLWIVLSVKML